MAVLSRLATAKVAAAQAATAAAANPDADAQFTLNMANATVLNIQREADHAAVDLEEALREKSGFLRAAAAAEERFGRMWNLLSNRRTAAFESEDQWQHQMQQQQQGLVYLETRVAAAAHNQGVDRAAILQLQQKVLRCQQLLEAAAAAAAAEQQDQPQQSRGSSSSQQKWQQQQTPGAAVATVRRQEPQLPRRTSKTSKQPGSSSNSSDQGEPLHQEPSQLVSKQVSK